MKLLLAILLAMPLTTNTFAQVFYVGTYTTGTSKGIYAYDLDAKSGKLSPLGLMAETPSPSFLAWHPSGKFLYAVNEAGKGSVTSFAVDPASHKLTQINQQPSMGDSPCHLAVDHTGKALIIANYGGGSAVSYPIAADGSIGAAASVMQHKGKGMDPKRQEAPHVHSAYLSNDNKIVYIADLGLDKVFRYALDPATAKLTPADPPSFQLKPGFGPRHIAFTKDESTAFVVNEMGNKVTVFKRDATGGMTEFESVSTLPANFAGQSTTAEIQLSAKGNVLYASNRGHDSIAVFSVKPNGETKLIQNISSGGAMPRSFTLDPSGNFLLAANQKGDNIVVFRVDAGSGKLTDTKVRATMSAPVDLLFVK